jgi:hypothetical protein
MFDSLNKIEPGRRPAVGPGMRNHNRFPQPEGRPNRAQTQIVLPVNLAPAHCLDQSAGRGTPHDLEPGLTCFRFVRFGLSYYFYLLAKGDKFPGKEAAHGLDPAQTGREGM